MNEAQKMASQAGAELRLLAPAGHLEAQALAAKLQLPLDVLRDVIADRSSVLERYTPRLNFEFD